MPSYNAIKDMEDVSERKRVTEKLLLLRAQLDRDIPVKTAADTLLIATWNIRAFGNNRRDESLYYIAEIINRFDLVAVQEVAADIAGLQKLVQILGNKWDYIVTNSTDGAAGGGERMAFIFDGSKIIFRRMTGAIILPEDMLIGQKLQFARTPYCVSFQAGWFKFMLATVHIYYGSSSKDNPRRLEEIAAVAGYINKRARVEGENYILMGDFNIFNRDDNAVKVLENNGFHIPEALRQHPTDLGKAKYYDQIALKLMIDPNMTVFSEGRQRAGAFNFAESVYAPGDLCRYKQYFDVKNTADKTDRQIENYYLTNWRTFQMSDHLPLWIELKIDFSNQYLERIEKTYC